MLERTRALVAGSSDQPAIRFSISQALDAALVTSPVVPPQPVDSRVDLLPLDLLPKQCQVILDCLEDPAAIPLADVQAKRDNPWDGVREAWLEHYNQVNRTLVGSAQMADKQVQSEVAGSVWKVLVKAGDSVTRDQELMILESMKMEIPVEAPCDGTVVSVLVAPEDGVEEDQVLLIITS